MSVSKTLVRLSSTQKNTGVFAPETFIKYAVYPQFRLRSSYKYGLPLSEVYQKAQILMAILFYFSSFFAVVLFIGDVDRNQSIRKVCRIALSRPLHRGCG